MVEFDWKRVNSTEELSVCLFRLFSGFADSGSVAEWLRASGFRVSEPHPISTAIMSKRGDEGVGKSISTGISLYKDISPLGKIIKKRIGGWFAHGLSIGLEFGSDGALDHVHVVVNRL